MKVRECAILTKEEVISQIKLKAIDYCQERIISMIEGSIPPAILTQFADIQNKKDIELIGELWLDHVQDDFWKDNPDVDEVVMETEQSITSPDTKLKMWLASRPKESK